MTVLSKTTHRLIAFSGAHGTGKTTAAFRKVEELKLANPDKSVCCIADNEAWCPYPINKQTSEAAQLWIFTNQIRRELEALARFDIVVTDRTVVDIVAYTQSAGFDGLAMAMQEMVFNYIRRYDSIFFKFIEFNNFWYSDGIREDRDIHYRQCIEDRICALYSGLTQSGCWSGEFNVI